FAINDNELHSPTSGSKNTSAMNPTIRRQLELLYGQAAAAEMEPRLAALTDPFRDRLPRPDPARAEWLTEKDALLITYADQVREPDRSPLQTLADFAAQH